MFVDVVGKINDEEAMLRLNLLSWFLDCRCVSSLSSSFSVCLGTAPYFGGLGKGRVSMRFLVIVALALCAFSSHVHAGCTCQCVDGQMQPLCSSTLDTALPCMGIREGCPLEIVPLARDNGLIDLLEAEVRKFLAEVEADYQMLVEAQRK
jgi:hypothetical protein